MRDLRLERLLIGPRVQGQLVPQQRLQGLALLPQLVYVHLRLRQQETGVARRDAVRLVSDGKGQLFQRPLHALVLKVKVAVLHRFR